MTSAYTKQRNLSLELVKVIAACFVVCIHVPFPGAFGLGVRTIGRFAVPFFFAVSGYYSLGIRPKQIQKRMVHLLKLHLVTALLCVAMNAFFLWQSPEDLHYYLRWETLPDAAEWFRWILLQENPYGGHLWYLTALLLCYGILWCYGKGQRRNGPLYGAGLVLFILFYILSLVLPAAGVRIPFQVYRNGWFLGLPMFLVGMFLREHGSAISLTDGTLAVLILLGAGLSLGQAFAGYESEMPLGMALLVPALLLFLQRHPRLPVGDPLEKAVSRLGVVSTAVYLLHIGVMDLCNRFLEIGEWGKPLVVLGLTLAAAFLWERIDWLLCHKKSPR